MLGDLRGALRSLLRDRGLSTVAAVSLAVGIAANTTVFSLVHAVEFPTLIYPDAANLVFLETDNTARGLEGMPVSAPDAADVFAAARTFANASLAGDQSSILDSGAGPVRVNGRRVTAGFFETFRVAAAQGRALGASDQPGHMVISDRLWRTHLAGAADVVGRPVRLDGGVVTIVGVMPSGFDADADLWTPLETPTGAFARDDRQFSVFARLAPGASLRDTQRELDTISQSLAADHAATNTGWVLKAFPLSRLHSRDARGTFFLLQAAVLVMLLIACANIANILLARGTRREAEMAVRVALGATRRRLVRQLLTESVALAVIGGLLGVVLSLWGVRLARALGGFPDVITPAINGPVLAFSMILAVATGLLSGVIPALRASTSDPERALRREASRGAVSSRGRIRDTLVAIQIVGAVVLATTGSLLVQSWLHRQQVELGFDPRDTVQASLADVTPDTIGLLLEGLRARPEVQAAAAVTWALPSGAGAQRALIRVDGTAGALDPSVRRGLEAVSPDYFRTRGIAVRRGRAIDAGDRAGGEPVAVVNEELARHLWRDADPIGAHLRLGASDDQTAPVVRVVGVVDTTRRSPVHDVAVARAYLPLAQFPNAQVQLIVRGRDPDRLPSTLRAVARDVNPALLLEGVTSVEADLAQFLAPARLMTTLLVGFAVIGLLLAGLGVFGTTSYVVSLRIRELAVRTALGATRRDVMRLVCRTALAPTLYGLTAGLVAAAFASRTIRAFLFGVDPVDWPTLTGVAVMLWLVAAAACYRPASVAARVDPMVVLRRD